MGNENYKAPYDLFDVPKNDFNECVKFHDTIQRENKK